jgi:hypothetical protein
MTYHLQLQEWRKMMTELDLQEATRRDDVYNELKLIVDRLGNLPVFPSLVWLWTFDVLSNIYDNSQEETEWADDIVPEGTTLKEIFDQFWLDVDTLGINMDLGPEIIEETIRDWMRENDFLVSLDEDDWDEDETTDEE